MPKGTDLSLYSQRQLDEIVHRLSTRPRAALDFLMPIEAYQAELNKLNQPAALHVWDQAATDDFRSNWFFWLTFNWLLRKFIR